MLRKTDAEKSKDTGKGIMTMTTYATMAYRILTMTIGVTESPKKGSRPSPRKESPPHEEKKDEDEDEDEEHPSSSSKTRNGSGGQHQNQQHQHHQRCPRSPTAATKRSRVARLLASGASLFLLNAVRIFRDYNKEDLKILARVPSNFDLPSETTLSTTSSLYDGAASNYQTQGFCAKHPQSEEEEASSSSSSWKHPKFLFGIPSTLSSPTEKERRRLLRETYLSFDQQIRQRAVLEMSNTIKDLRYAKSLTEELNLPPNRACSLQEYTCGDSTTREHCQIIFAFVVGGNASAPPYILDETLDDFRSMLYLPSTSGRDAVVNEPGLVALNIRENQFDGKMTTWFQFAALVGLEYPEIDYAVKADSDTLVFTPNFLEHLEIRHMDVLSRVHPHVTSEKKDNRKDLPTERVYGGVKFPKTYCGKAETHHPCPLPLIGDTYMSGELSFMSMDLARFIASEACPRANVTLPHEDVSLSNYVYSYTNNSKVITRALSSSGRGGGGGTLVNTTIERIFIHPERLLLTFNESADWESKKNGLTVDLEKRYRRFLWGHCNNRSHKKDFELYSFFKQPDKVRKIWEDFVSYYFNGVYYPMIHQSPPGLDETADNDASNNITSTTPTDASSSSLWSEWKLQTSSNPDPTNDQWKHLARGRDHQRSDLEQLVTAGVKKSKNAYNGPPPFQSCAILLFGLPRSFKRYVLPSIIRNVMIPNLKYGCDYYMHYYQVDREGSSRSGHGGTIDADDVFLLKGAMEQIYNNSDLLHRVGVPANRTHLVPRMSFSRDTNDTFWEKRSELVHKYRTTRGKDGKYLYFPQNEVNYVYPSTMDNIVKQWHSIDAVWRDMDSSKGGRVYDRVAMIRNDVVYITPLDVYQMSHAGLDFNNEYMIIPNWANWPVNDRMISGPYDAVKVWATERFPRIDQHVLTVKPGLGMHPEKFLHRTILPLIRQEFGYKLDQNKRICFVRVR
jgi:hypothetical protein